MNRSAVISATEFADRAPFTGRDGAIDFAIKTELLEQSTPAMDNSADQLASQTKAQMFSVLGEAVTKIWSDLPHDLQQRLFEDAVMSNGESMRQQLAIFLHEKHFRTTDAAKIRAIPEPDSKGG